MLNTSDRICTVKVRCKNDNDFFSNTKFHILQDDEIKKTSFLPDEKMLDVAILTLHRCTGIL